MKSEQIYRQDGEKTYVLVFDIGDEVVSNLLEFARTQAIAAGHFTAIGGFSDVTLGYFQLEVKDYKHINVAEQVEVLSLVGNFAVTAEGEPKVHAHVVVGKSDGSAYGGHLLRARVRPTLEVVVIESPRHLQRISDPNTGLALLKL